VEVVAVRQAGVGSLVARVSIVAIVVGGVKW
jgi:hypothetical protein